MKNHLLLILILFTLTACMESVEQKASFILSEDSMVNIMIDIHLLESAISQKNLPRDSSALIYSLYEKDLFKKHGINDSIYKENFNYYATHPSYMHAVYERVVDSLSWREEKGGGKIDHTEIRESHKKKLGNKDSIDVRDTIRTRKMPIIKKAKEKKKK